MKEFIDNIVEVIKKILLNKKNMMKPKKSNAGIAEQYLDFYPSTGNAFNYVIDK
jgi:hypothetical protein